MRVHKECMGSLNCKSSLEVLYIGCYYIGGLEIEKSYMGSKEILPLYTFCSEISLTSSFCLVFLVLSVLLFHLLQVKAFCPWRWCTSGSRNWILQQKNKCMMYGIFSALVMDLLCIHDVLMLCVVKLCPDVIRYQIVFMRY